LLLVARHSSLVTTVLILNAFLFGLVFGSFLNVVIYRWPRQESIVRPRSHCPACDRQIAWYDNIPLLSYILLRGHCRHCGARISPRYFAIELLTGVAFVLLASEFGATAYFAKYAIFVSLAIPLAFIDLDVRLLPNAITFPGMAVGLLFSLVAPVPGGPAQWLAGPAALPGYWRLLSLADSAFGALAAALGLWAVGLLYFAARHRMGMGLGDVKMIAMVGTFLGFWLAVLTVLVASVMGTVISLPLWAFFMMRRIRNEGRSRRRRTRRERLKRILLGSFHYTMQVYRLPFGTALALAAVISVLWGQEIVRWYLSVL
jgi:leader peptidase (prepilin peptidase)/N-methyltransferase